MSVFWLIGGLVFAMGAAVGSFLNVLIYRTTRGQDWVKDRSRCEHCRKPISWYENIPLISYLFLRGRCSHCGKKIDTIHPLIEMLVGSLFLWWYVAGFLFFRLTSAPMQFIQPVFWLFVGTVSAAIIISDLKHFLIPRWTVLALTGSTLLYRAALILAGEMRPADFFQSVLWALLLTGFFWFLWKVTREKGFGFGDVQLAFPLGLILGHWERILVGIFSAFLIGAAVGMLLVISGKKRFRQAVPFGPFLLLGTLIGLVWGFELWAGYVRMLQG
jgi:prepilin signal peptidase PulO-like enzyme (type II secretory pathway)